MKIKKFTFVRGMVEVLLYVQFRELDANHIVICR